MAKNEISILSGELDTFHWNPKADSDFETMSEAINVLKSIENGHQFWIGDALIFARNKFGEKYTQFIDEENKANWLNYVWVCSRVAPDIRKELTGYTQARIVARLSPERQRALIDELRVKALTARELTDEVRKMTRTSGDSGDLPDTQFKIIYADPPWQYDDSRDGLKAYSAAEDHYPTMPLQAICDMPVRSISEKDSVLFLWVPAPLLLSHAPHVIAAWGYEYKAQFVWDKQLHNFGNYNSVRHELLMICTRGSCVPDKSYKLEDSVQSIKRTNKHSEKPKKFREIIDAMYPKGNRIELFARGSLPDNWQRYGNE